MFTTPSIIKFPVKPFLQRLILTTTCLLSFLIVNPVHAAFITYEFNNTLAANETGAPSLTAINPLGLNDFTTATVFGENRTVYRFDGNKSPVDQQAGLSLDASGLISGDAFSVEMVFSFDADDATWERILDVSNRQSDNGFYVNPTHQLEVWPTGDGPNLFTFGEFHHVTLTNDGSGHVTSYLDGIFQFDLDSSSLNFSAYAAENPGRLMHFFADNVIDGGQGEFVDGYVSLIRLHDVELTPEEVANLGNDPFTPVPEPATMLLLGSGLVGLAGFGRKKFKK